MECGKETTSPKKTLSETNTDNRRYQTGGRIPFIQTITAGASGPDIEQLSEEAIGKMVSDSLQGGKTEVTMVAVSQTQGEVTGTMMSANPQGGATGTVVPSHPQGGATGTMVPARPQGGAIGTMVPSHPQGGATGTMVPARPHGGATGTMVPARPHGGVIGTMVPARPHGGVIGTMVPAYPQGETTLVQVQKQRIGNVNFSFSGGEANVLGDNNTVNISKNDDETKALMTDVKEMVSEYKQTMKTQKTSQKTSATQTSDPVATMVKSKDTSQARKIHPDLEPMIETAKARIQNEKEEKKFFPTKGFFDAKEKLKKNRVVVIKGNTGDGKTAIAVQLLHWLSQEEGAGQPLQLHRIKDLRLLAPSLKLITFIDDIFGEKDVSMKDVQEWNKRIFDVKTCFVDEQTQPNFLIITIRNEVFNSLEKSSIGTILTKDNLIDLSADIYKNAEERKGLLELYTPKHFSWRDEEKTQVLSFASNIGFPQCCQLFYNSKELQKERVAFFKNPFHFLKDALLKLKECSALLYLFLNDGEIKVKDFDPNSEKVNEKLLEEAFNINLIDGEDDSTKFTYKKKIRFVKENLERLLGFLVVKENGWSGDEVYRFNHDSIFVAVAVLYGKVTPIGYIQNCPSKSLSYITTSETGTNRVVISSDLYKEMCERLIREFEKWYSYGSIGSLDVWNDPVFVKRFVWLLNDRKVDKLAVLNKACLYGAIECVLYLLSEGVLSEGVKPDNVSALLSLINRHWNDSIKVCLLLGKTVNYFNDETKTNVLNQACLYHAEECVVYLLSEGVKPDEDTNLWSLIDDHRNDRNKQVCLLRKLVDYMNDETKLAVLNEACLRGAEEYVVYLLSEGVKPDEDTDLWSLIDDHRNDRNKQVCLLRKLVDYMNDETKLAVLNEACLRGAEEYVVYLLSEGVKPDEDTDLWSLIDDHRNDRNKQVCLLRKLVDYMNDETKLAVLNKACLRGAIDCVLYLLSEGVKPDNVSKLLSMIKRPWNDNSRLLCLLKKIVVYLNDETKVNVINEACFWGANESVLYLLGEGVEPDEDTVFHVVRKGREKLLRKLLEYEITHTARDKNNYSVLHVACQFEKEEIVTLLCDTYPHLLHDVSNGNGETPLHVAAQKGNCSVFQTVERFVLNSLYRVEDQQHKCETVDGRTVHRNCVCAQYMAQLVCIKGQTVLHKSCEERNREVSLYICQSYPSLSTAVDNDGRHCLHYLAGSPGSDVDCFTECETHVKQFLEHTGRKYDITTVLDNDGKTVLHYSCQGGNRELCLYLCRLYPSLSTAIDKDGRYCLHYIAGSWRSDEYCFTECETHVKQYLESTGRKYDIKTIRDNDGKTVLHNSCRGENRELCLYLCRSYPSLTTAVDRYGRHCLHYLACSLGFYKHVDWFTECETLLKQYLESTGCKYDITTILDNDGKSVLDMAKETANYWWTEKTPLLEHLKSVWKIRFDFK